MPKVITIIEKEGDQYKCRLDVDQLEGVPYEIIINSLVKVTDMFIHSLNQTQKNAEKDNLQLQQPETPAATT